MKKKSFYKKIGSLFAIALGMSIATSAQSNTSFYTIDNVHNGDGGMGSISVLNLIVQNGSKLSLNVFQKPDSIIWMHYDLANPQIQYSSDDSIIILKNSEVVRAYVLLDQQWYTQKDIFKSTFYTIDNVHNGDGGMGSISVLNLIVQNGSKLSLNVFQKPDSIIWMHYDSANPQTQYNSNDSIIVIKNSEVVRAYVLLNKQWYTQKDVFKAPTDTTTQNPIDSSSIKNDTGTFYNPYEASDIIVKDELNFSISNSYTADSVLWYCYGLHDSTYFTSTEPSITLVKDAVISLYVLSHGKWYTQKNTFYGISYDSTGSGQLTVPVISDATYTWYLNDSLLQDITTYSYIPIDTGTYKVVVEWTVVANVRTESSTNSATFEFKVKSLPVVTSIESQKSETSIAYVYPNPTSEHVYINEKGIFEYRIESTNATIVATGIGNALTQVDLNGLNSGVYFVYINTGNKQTVKKLIIK